jgi:hypothetical protein
MTAFTTSCLLVWLSSNGTFVCYRRAGEMDPELVDAASAGRVESMVWLDHAQPLDDIRPSMRAGCGRTRPYKALGVCASACNTEQCVL